MEIGIGSPATIPGVDRASLLEFARRADQRGFVSLGVVDRIVYPNYEPLLALMAAAAVTERIRLTTTVLLGPLRTNTALLAKEIATLDNFSNGRFVLGIALGARDDDYTASGLSTKTRGRALDQQLEEMKRIWGGEKRGFAGGIGPPPAHPEGPPILVGGQADASFKRAARFGDGWISGAGGPDAFKEAADKARAAWTEAGRQGSPRLAALCYYALGPNAEQDADWYIHSYYGFAGAYADMLLQVTARNEDTLRDYLGRYEAAGCDELIFFPCSKDPQQVDLLASVVGK